MTKIIDNELKAKVRASYALTNSYNSTAKEMGISDHTVKKIINENPEEFNKVSKEKKKEFADRATTIIDKAMNKLEKLIDNEDVAANHLTTVIGTLYDKRALAKGESTNNESITIKMSNEVKELSK